MYTMCLLCTEILFAALIYDSHSYAEVIEEEAEAKLQDTIRERFSSFGEVCWISLRMHWILTIYSFINYFLLLNLIG